jgi:hypothetical protein
MSEKITLVKYQNKRDLGISLVTSIISHDEYIEKTDKLTNIYKYGSQDRYFKVLNDIKYIGYVSDGVFVVVNLHDDDNPELEYKNNFNFIDKNIINILESTNYSEQSKIIKQLNKINFFNYYKSFPPRSVSIINLNNAKKNT